MSVTGGQATSISLDKEKYGTSWMNDGVQGGSPAFKHTLNYFKKYGHAHQDVKLQVSFGQGKESFWTNCFPSQLVDQFSADIKKFGRVLKIIKYTMPVLGLVPIRIMLRMFFFNKEFGEKMVFPLIALFLGTGMLPTSLDRTPALLFLASSKPSQAIKPPTSPAQSSNASSTTQT